MSLTLMHDVTAAMMVFTHLVGGSVVLVELASRAAPLEKSPAASKLASARERGRPGRPPRGRQQLTALASLPRA
jgi:hypothetical protein